MKQLKIFSTMLFFALSVLTVNARAQLVIVSESTLDFGSVALGTTAVDYVTLTAVNGRLIVDPTLNNNGFSYQSVGGALGVSAGDEVSYAIHFSPVSNGDATATLEFQVSDGSTRDGNGELIYSTVRVELIGTGGTPGTPLALIRDIITFFDASIANGSLKSTGPSNNSRYKALRNRLKTVDWLIRNGYFGQATYVLDTAILRSDGQPGGPPDLVCGVNQPSLNAQLVLLQALLNE